MKITGFFIKEVYDLFFLRIGLFLYLIRTIIINFISVSENVVVVKNKI